MIKLNDLAIEYIHERSQIGAVYIPRHGVVVSEDARIRYERRPWIEHFELDGIKPADVCCIWTPPVSEEYERTH